MSRSWAAVWVLSLAIVGVFSYIGHLMIDHLNRETPEKVAKRGIESILSGNAKALLPLISEEEKVAESLTEENLGELLTLVKGRLRDFHTVGEPEVPPDQGNRSSVIQKLESSDGEQVGIAVEASYTPSGLRCDRVAVCLLHALVWLERSKSERSQHGLDSHKAHIDAYGRLLPELKKLKLKGVSKRAPDGTLRFVSWEQNLDDVKASYERAVKRAAAARTLRGTPP